ncbi:sensor histidine kinase [Kitasatospora sp. NPDC048540]|uniref:sensor histidine kinase n=1 Tax=Kitasatospora sp. NPDC048540 TaxID=3155634 RepID=UPI0033DBF5A4
MDTTTRTRTDAEPAAARRNDPPGRPGPVAAGWPALWGGSLLYALTVLLLPTGAPSVSGTFQGLAAVLAVGLLTGVLRQRPLLALALTLAGSLMLVVLSRDVRQPDRFLAFLAADIALGFVSATRTRPVVLAAAAVSAAVQLLTAGGFAYGPDRLVAISVVALLGMVTAYVVGLLVRERREHGAALRRQEVAEAVTAERLRIARELHDMVAHSIGIIAIQAGVGSRVIETQPAEAREALRAIEATGRETLAGLRRTLVALRQADPTGAGPASAVPVPGLADLDRLAAATADAGVRVEVHRSGDQRPIPAEIDLSAYRIVQEALTNVVRHAATTHCRVTVEHGDGELLVEVVDDGRGAQHPGAAHGFGIIGMRERVALLHGAFSAGPRAEGGFRVAARLPLPTDTHGPAVAG